VACNGFATAASLYGRAADLFATSEARARTRVARARALFRSGDKQGAMATAEAAYRLAVAHAEDATRPGEPALVEVALAMSDFAEFGLTDTRCEQVLAEALDTVPEDAHAIRAELAARAVVARFYRDPNTVEEDGLLAAAQSAAQPCDDPTVALRVHVASMMLWRADRLAQRSRAVAAMQDLVPRLRSPRDRFEVARWAFNTALERCDGDAAHKALDQLDLLAEQLGTPRERFVAVLRRVTLWQLEGRFDAIEVAGRRAGDPHAHFFRHAWGALRAVVRGDRATVDASTPVIAGATRDAWGRGRGARAATVRAARDALGRPLPARADRETRSPRSCRPQSASAGGTDGRPRMPSTPAPPSSRRSGAR
jgi:hypothetical protein